MCLSDDSRSGDCLGPNQSPATDGGKSPLNRILTSLQDDRRRYLLYCLQEENACELDEAARRVAALDQGYDVGDVPSRSQDRLELELYHIHLPKLKDLNIVDYDERSGSIRFQDPPDRLDAFLDLAREADELE